MLSPLCPRSRLDGLYFIDRQCPRSLYVYLRRWDTKQCDIYSRVLDLHFKVSFGWYSSDQSGRLLIVALVNRLTGRPEIGSVYIPLIRLPCRVQKRFIYSIQYRDSMPIEVKRQTRWHSAGGKAEVKVYTHCLHQNLPTSFYCAIRIGENRRPGL